MITIHDAEGRIVANLFDGEASQGLHELIWDGRDEAGRPVSSGVYFARIGSGAQSATRRIVRIRS